MSNLRRTLLRSLDHRPKSDVAVPEERVFMDRTQGCWNCKHWANGTEAVNRWTQLRQRDLSRAVEISLASPHGENDVKVQNIRNMVDSLDHAVASGMAGICHGNGRTANGAPVGDFTMSSLLCDRWSGKVGASVAREGQKADTLPEELADKLDGTPSPGLDAIAEAKAKGTL